jgi:hypothetical protein
MDDSMQYRPFMKVVLLLLIATMLPFSARANLRRHGRRRSEWCAPSGSQCSAAPQRRIDA